MPMVPHSFLCTHQLSRFLRNQVSNTAHKDPRKEQQLNLVTHVFLSLYPSERSLK